MPRERRKIAKGIKEKKENDSNMPLNFEKKNSFMSCVKNLTQSTISI